MTDIKPLWGVPKRVMKAGMYASDHVLQESSVAAMWKAMFKAYKKKK